MVCVKKSKHILGISLRCKGVYESQLLVMTISFKYIWLSTTPICLKMSSPPELFVCEYAILSRLFLTCKDCANIMAFATAIRDFTRTRNRRNREWFVPLAEVNLRGLTIRRRLLHCCRCMNLVGMLDDHHGPILVKFIKENVRVRHLVSPR